MSSVVSDVFRRMQQVALLAAFAALGALPSFAGGKWVLKKEVDGIRIYTSTSDDSKFKSICVTLTTTGTPAQLAAILMDIPGQTDWVYSTKSSKVLKRVSDAEVICYSEKTMPWPVSNRDVVLQFRVAVDAATGVLTARGNTVQWPVAEKDGVVRVPQATVAWRATPASPTTIAIEYEARIDPGGDVPAWVVNLFISKGPLETFGKLKEKLAAARQ